MLMDDVFKAEIQLNTATELCKQWIKNGSARESADWAIVAAHNGRLLLDHPLNFTRLATESGE